MPRPISYDLNDSRVCENCGVRFFRVQLTVRETHMRWMRRRFCGQPCRLMWLASEDGKRFGEAHSGWKGDAATRSAGYSRANKLYRETLPCEVCGTQRVERHHNDGNPVNNARENIAFLCSKHHKAADRERRRREAYA